MACAPEAASSLLGTNLGQPTAVPSSAAEYTAEVQVPQVLVPVQRHAVLRSPWPEAALLNLVVQQAYSPFDVNLGPVAHLDSVAAMADPPLAKLAFASTCSTAIHPGSASARLVHLLADACSHSEPLGSSIQGHSRTESMSEACASVPTPSAGASQGPQPQAPADALAAAAIADIPPPRMLVQRMPPRDVIAGFQGDWLAVSPPVLPQWDKVELQPYSAPKRVQYWVVCPQQYLSLALMFFKDVGARFDDMQLGTHVAGPTPMHLHCLAGAIPVPSEAADAAPDAPPLAPPAAQSLGLQVFRPASRATGAVLRAAVMGFRSNHAPSPADPSVAMPCYSEPRNVAASEAASGPASTQAAAATAVPAGAAPSGSGRGIADAAVQAHAALASGIGPGRAGASSYGGAGQGQAVATPEYWANLRYVLQQLQRHLLTTVSARPPDLSAPPAAIGLGVGTPHTHTVLYVVPPSDGPEDMHKALLEAASCLSPITPAARVQQLHATANARDDATVSGPAAPCSSSCGPDQGHLGWPSAAADSGMLEAGIGLCTNRNASADSAPQLPGVGRQQPAAVSAGAGPLPAADVTLQVVLPSSLLDASGWCARATACSLFTKLRRQPACYAIQPVASHEPSHEQPVLPSAPTPASDHPQPAPSSLSGPQPQQQQWSQPTAMALHNGLDPHPSPPAGGSDYAAGRAGQGPGSRGHAEAASSSACNRLLHEPLLVLAPAAPSGPDLGSREGSQSPVPAPGAPELAAQMDGAAGCSAWDAGDGTSFLHCCYAWQRRPAPGQTPDLPALPGQPLAAALRRSSALAASASGPKAASSSNPESVWLSLAFTDSRGELLEAQALQLWADAVDVPAAGGSAVNGGAAGGSGSSLMEATGSALVAASPCACVPGAATPAYDASSVGQYHHAAHALQACPRNLQRLQLNLGGAVAGSGASAAQEYGSTGLHPVQHDPGPLSLGSVAEQQQQQQHPALPQIEQVVCQRVLQLALAMRARLAASFQEARPCEQQQEQQRPGGTRAGFLPAQCAPAFHFVSITKLGAMNAAEAAEWERALREQLPNACRSAGAVAAAGARAVLQVGSCADGLADAAGGPAPAAHGHLSCELRVSVSWLLPHAPISTSPCGGLPQGAYLLSWPAASAKAWSAAGKNSMAEACGGTATSPATGAAGPLPATLCLFPPQQAMARTPAALGGINRQLRLMSLHPLLDSSCMPAPQRSPDAHEEAGPGPAAAAANGVAGGEGGKRRRRDSDNDCRDADEAAVATSSQQQQAAKRTKTAHALTGMYQQLPNGFGPQAVSPFAAGGAASSCDVAGSSAAASAMTLHTRLCHELYGLCVVRDTLAAASSCARGGVGLLASKRASGQAHDAALLMPLHCAVVQRLLELCLACESLVPPV